VEWVGVPAVTFHTLRHTAATWLLSSGVSPNVVAGMFGHTTTRMTLDTYGHVLPGDQLLAVEKMEVFISGRQPVVTLGMETTRALKAKSPIPLQDGRLIVLENIGLEPMTPCMPCKCSTN